MQLTKTFTQKQADFVLNTFSTNTKFEGTVVTKVTVTQERDDEQTYINVSVEHTNANVSLYGNIAFLEMLEDTLHLELVYCTEQAEDKNVCLLTLAEGAIRHAA